MYEVWQFVAIENEPPYYMVMCQSPWEWQVKEIGSALASRYPPATVTWGDRKNRPTNAPFINP